jgi:hypothetical protein
VLRKDERSEGTKSHPDSLSFNAKLFSYLARFVLPVWNLLNALAPLVKFTSMMYSGIKLSR